MGFLDDLRKTASYARRNGLAAAYDAVMERLSDRRVPYTYTPPSAEELRRQKGTFSREVKLREDALRDGREALPLPKFSILTPMYRTPEPYLRALIDSVKAQSYGHFELILADASPAGAQLQKIVMEQASDARVMYLPLHVNRGIADNTNAALAQATGDYAVLLDHDDLLAPDALYAFYEAIRAAGTLPALLYSDEDKWDGAQYFEPNRKPDFDLELLLSNNYICHLSAIRMDLMRRLKLRAGYEGSQDYDLLLRVAGEVLGDHNNKIIHVDRVLYHWRTHHGSTAANPASKNYAYIAGRAAVEDFLRTTLALPLLSAEEAEIARSGAAYAAGDAPGGVRNGAQDAADEATAGRHATDSAAAVGSGMPAGVRVTPLRHLGFHRVDYYPDVFALRPEIGAVGGRLVDTAGTLIGGLMDEEGNVFFEGMPAGFSGGFTHRAVVQQTAQALDLRCIRVCEALMPLYEEITGVPCDPGVPLHTIEDDAATASEEKARETPDGEADVQIPPPVRTGRKETPGDENTEDASAEENSDREANRIIPPGVRTAAEWIALSLRFSEAVKAKGYRLLFDPALSETIRPVPLQTFLPPQTEPEEREEPEPETEPEDQTAPKEAARDAAREATAEEKQKTTGLHFDSAV